MKNFIIKLLVTTVAVMFAVYILKGVHLKNDDFVSALWLAALLGVLNAFIKPLLILFTLPATIFSLGLFLLVINAVIIIIADKLIDEFWVDSFWWALAFSLIVSMISSIFESVLKKDKIMDAEGDK
jgi:putative membrane protein